MQFLAGNPRLVPFTGLFAGRISGSLFEGFCVMSRVSLLNSPLLLGFDEIERLLDRVSKASGDGYPPYNIEQVPGRDGVGETIRITLAVAGVEKDQLEVTVEGNQLIIRGKQVDEQSKSYLHRGIATRQFVRTFVVADGIDVNSANMENGLLSIDLVRPEPERLVRRIEIH